MRMHKSAALSAALAGTLLLAACGGGGSGEATSDATGAAEETSAATGGDISGEDPIVLTLGHAGSETDPRQAGALRFKELVEESSDGQITVEVFPSATLGTWEEMIEGMQLGSTDVVIEAISSLESYSDLAAIETAPFVYETDDQFFAVWDGELGDEINKAITADSGYAMMGKMYRSSRELTTKEPVTQLSDLQGMTIRTPSAQTMMATWEALGARAEALPFNEVYSALEAGVLDGQENPLDTIIFNSIHEVAPYIALTHHMYANYYFLMWDEYLQGLPASYQEIIREAADTVGQEYTATTLASMEQYRADLESDGAVFTELTDREAWVDATQPIRDSLPEQVREWISEIKGM